ncbi:hypothetical protein B0T21DRAFT_416079 [Apiosordaria backusii]|uniref:Uncharacterized protein n=1 Tax=Apiosordaria backusii TaxID=314023 RepID=A0AA40A7D3_9PEZI|nr:hypothetical protein B0T21DRAFT_416079 [Apiosordaria backusii]
MHWHVEFWVAGSTPTPNCVKTLLETPGNKNPTTQTLEEAQEEIALLKSHLNSALVLIEQNNLFKGYVDPASTTVAVDTTGSLRDLLKLRIGSGDLADKIRIKMRRAYLRVHKTLNKERRMDVTSDDLSWKMQEFLEPIREVVAFDDKQGLAMAEYILDELRTNSFDTEFPGLGDRAPDGKADKLLAFVIRRCDEMGMTETKRTLLELLGKEEPVAPDAE